MRVDTTSALAAAQWRANMQFAERFAPLVAPHGRLPRVLMTGFGRFAGHPVNATAQIVSALLGEAAPVAALPEPGAIDPPEAHTRAALGALALDGVGEVDVCAMVLPVFWDLAAALIAKQLDAFAPDFVVMNGVACPRQDLWLELGAINEGQATCDGSNNLCGVAGPLIARADAEPGRANLASWRALREAAHERVCAGGFGDVLPGVSCKAFPRPSNTFLCNNTSYTVGWLMDHPGVRVPLMEASAPRGDGPSAHEAAIERDLRQVPRLFLHWPAQLAGDDIARAADVLRAVVGAQLRASAEGDVATRGHNGIADDL